MRLRPIATIAAVAATLAQGRTATAQSIGRILKDDFSNAGRDVVSIWASPSDASRQDWLIAGASLGVFGLTMFADQSVSDWALRNEDSDFFNALSPVRRGGKLFAGKYVVPPVAATYILGVAIRNQGMRDLAMGCIASWGAQAVVRHSLYTLIGRARPESLPNNPQTWKVPSGGKWEMHSFPAGHFANAMSCATFAAQRFDLGAGDVALYSLAAAVGVGRLADGAHWTSDTVLGGILGYAVGREIARRSSRRLNDSKRAPQVIIGPDPAGFALGISWTP